MASWHVWAVTLPRPAIAPVSRGLRSLGAIGLQEDLPDGVTVTYRQPWDTGPAPRAPRQVRLRAWFDARPDDDAIEAVLAGWSWRDAAWDLQREEDWSETWKEHFQPVTVSERLTVAAPWHNVPGALIIEPGYAFGTGEHPTTRACLRAVCEWATPGETLLDVGCGSGILALAGAKLGMAAYGVDIDPEAVRAAREANALNALDARFDTTPIEKVEGAWDVVVANLFAEVLVALSPEIKRLARGRISLAGILADRADMVRAAFSDRRALLDETAEGWTTLRYGPPAEPATP